MLLLLCDSTTILWTTSSKASAKFELRLFFGGTPSNVRNYYLVSRVQCLHGIVEALCNRLIREVWSLQIWCTTVWSRQMRPILTWIHTGRFQRRHQRGFTHPQQLFGPSASVPRRHMLFPSVIFIECGEWGGGLRPGQPLRCYKTLPVGFVRGWLLPEGAGKVVLSAEYRFVVEGAAHVETVTLFGCIVRFLGPRGLLYKL